MKICTYKTQTSLGLFKRLGILIGDSDIVDINFIWRKQFEIDGCFDPIKKADDIAPSSLSKILSSYQEASIPFLQETLELANEFQKLGITHTEDGAALIPSLDDHTSLTIPLDKINCYRDFYVHEKHVKKGFEKRNEEVPAAWYEMPAYYKGPTSGFIGPEDTVMWPYYTDKLDFELEFGVVIGKDGKNIPADEAMEHIFGYTVFNDISARDIQKKEMSIRLGPAKGKDFCSVVGPVIVTADEFNFQEPSLTMTATINGEEWSRGKTSDAHYTWAQMIEHASKEEWLLATDFMGSGTVGTGCGLEIDKWIQPGDKITLEIESIGKLTNTIGEKNEDIND